MSVRRFVLASQSPRRRQLLAIAGYDFDILPSQISEIPDENLNLTSQIRQLASDKAEACLKMGNFAKGQGILILASDTVVVLDGQILGKPKDENEARSFLRRLSAPVSGPVKSPDRNRDETLGQTQKRTESVSQTTRVHDVITGVSLIDVDTGRRLSDHAVTHVHFHALTDAQIDAYVATGDPLDKAGAYGIQSRLASDFVSRIEGDYDTVMGLPMTTVERMLGELGVSAKRRQSPIAENLDAIRAQMMKSSATSNPDLMASGVSSVRSSVRLVAVSKTKPEVDVIEAWKAGQRIFGENYVQEAIAKIADVDRLLRILGAAPGEFPVWHFIGSLQTKKVKQVVGAFELIHSVDRTSLLDELEKRSLEFATQTGDADFRQRILLQINIANEDTKGGVGREEFFDLFEKAIRCPHLRVCGMMALPPLTDDRILARRRFAEVRSVFEQARTRLPQRANEGIFSVQGDFTELSMGTTHDFEDAILEGATLIRVGTAIFGSRRAAHAPTSRQ